jgi:trehalose-6-phosphatase
MGRCEEATVMRHHALACDYDGTIAHDGQVSGETVAGLKRLADAGRKLLLVTGRELDDLLKVFPQVELFDRVVAENGRCCTGRPRSRPRRSASGHRSSSRRPCASAGSIRCRSAR